MAANPLNRLGDYVEREPARFVAAVVASVAVGQTLGFYEISQEQYETITFAFAAWVGVIVRQSVVPVVKARKVAIDAAAASKESTLKALEELAEAVAVASKESPSAGDQLIEDLLER